MTLTKRDLSRLVGVHADLKAVVIHADGLGAIRFMVLEGIRTLERQKLLLKQGATTTLRSRHLTGHAVDLAPVENGAPSWHWPHYDRMAPVLKAVAEDLGLPIEWGGDWERFPDGPHWQLPWAEYPV